MDFSDILRTKHTWSSSAKLRLPDDQGFADMSEPWSSMNPPSFAASLSVDNIDDVRAAVSLCTSHQIPFIAMSSQHGYSSRIGEFKDGLHIDLRRLNKIDINASANTMTVGPGTTFGDIFDPLHDAGKEMTTGICPTVSVIGATLGAGVGRFQAFHGLLIDHLLSARVVTATGDLVTASAEEKSDLFWALRGAGAFMGITVEATYRVHDQSNGGVTQNADLVFPMSIAPAFWKIVAALGPTLPRELLVSVVAAWDPRADMAILYANLTFPGPQDKFLEHVQPFLDLQPVVNVIKAIPWNRLVYDSLLGMNPEFSTKKHPKTMYNVVSQHVDADTLIAVTHSLSELYNTYPEARGSTIALEWYGTEVVRRVPAEDTAFAWRDATGYFLVFCGHNASNQAADTAAQKWARATRAKLAAAAGYPPLKNEGENNGNTSVGFAHRAFITYVHGDETPEQVWGQNLEKVREVKKKWDPQGAFCVGSGKDWF